jgi:integrase
MRHLHAYANFLESTGFDWRHFPIRRDERTLVRFRGDLIEQIKSGQLQSSTARARMSAVIQFYRYAESHGLVSPHAAMWSEKTVVVPWFDSTGFKRTMTRVVTDLHIPNRARPGVRLEDGLLPLPSQAMIDLLRFTAQEQTTELHLMLCVGFFTGARAGTITTLRRENLDSARPDPFTPGFFLIRVGPGTGVATKFDVAGELLVHNVLLDDLKAYASSVERLRRQVKASETDKTILFLTRRGNRYSVNALDRLVQELRKDAIHSGLHFMEKFRFHQTRATYGTWLMKLMLNITTVSAAIEFVRRVMLHKHESTTFRYVKFLENTKGKQEIAQAFNEVFTGLRDRDWDRLDA